MATISWTGAVSSSFFNSDNWSPSEIPGSDDVVVVPVAPVGSLLALGASVTIGGLAVEGSMGVSAGTLTVDGQTTVEGSLLISGGSFAVLSGLAIANGGAVSNLGLVVSGTSATLPGAADTGVFQNLGTLQLTGTLAGRIENSATVNVLDDAAVSSYSQSSTGMLFLLRAMTVQGHAAIEGAVSVSLSADPATSGHLGASGILSIGLSSLAIDTNDAGAMSEGTERPIFSSSSTAMDAFSVASYGVIGQHADFAYALRLSGFDTFVGGLSLIALNDGASGGRAVLEDSATSRAITLAIDSDTGRGTIRGGSFADLHNSLLHGIDEVRSGSGNDILTVAGGTAGFTLAGNGGNDRLTGRVGDDVLSGGNGSDTLIGGDGADRLDGGGGVDRLVGGLGSDVYVVNTAADVIVEAAGGGTDLVRSTVSLSLAAEVENATAMGSGAINLTGNSLDNRLVGNAAANRLSGAAGKDTLNGGAGADTLDGGTGADVAIGGAGNDVFIVDNIGDRLSDSAGLDLVRTTVSFTLTSGLENGTILGSDAVNLTGNGLANRLFGNAASNILRGGTGNDTITGGAGDDTLSGGAGADTFVFTRGSGQDRITDFTATGAGSDRIDFSNHSLITGFADLMANHLTASGSTALISAGGDVIRLTNVQISDLDAGDFIF